jgi:hypothetical protein
MQRVLVMCGLAGWPRRGCANRSTRRCDRDPQRRLQPGAGLLTGNAVAALDRLGLSRAARDASRLVREIAFSDEKGRELFHLDLDGHRAGGFVSINASLQDPAHSGSRSQSGSASWTPSGPAIRASESASPTARGGNTTW